MCLIRAAQLLIIRNIDTLRLDRIISLFRCNILQERLIIQTIQEQSNLKKIIHQEFMRQTYMSDSPSPKPRKLLDQIRDASRLQRFCRQILNHSLKLKNYSSVNKKRPPSLESAFYFE